MIDRRCIELINAEIDGANSPAGSEEVRRRLAADPEAQRYYEELLEVGRIMASAERVSPPPGLREAILSKAARHDAAGASPLASRLRKIFASSPRMRLAYAFAGGIAAGVCLFALVARSVPAVAPGDTAALFGTMGPAAGRPGEPLRFDARGVSGAAVVRCSDGVVALDLSLSSEKEIVVVLSPEDDRLGFRGVLASPPCDISVRVRGRTAELTHTGARDYSFLFSGDRCSRAGFRVEVRGPGGVLFEGRVPSGRE